MLSMITVIGMLVAIHNIFVIIFIIQSKCECKRFILHKKLLQSYLMESKHVASLLLSKIIILCRTRRTKELTRIIQVKLIPIQTQATNIIIDCILVNCCTIVVLNDETCDCIDGDHSVVSLTMSAIKLNCIV